MARGGSRFVELDGLRGIAAGAVVLYHVFHEYDVYFHPPVPAAPVQFSRGYFGVHLFFLISGFVILMTARASPRARDFASARFSRLYPTYWVCLTISWVTVALVGVAGLERTTAEIATNYTMVQRILGVHDVDGAYWSLSVELVFYGVVLVALAARRTLDTPGVRRLVVAWCSVAVLVGVLVRLRPDDARVHLLGVLSVAEFAPLFCTGMLLLCSRGHERIEPLVVPTVAAAAAVTWLFHDLRSAAIVTVISCGFAWVVLGSGCRPLRRRPLVFLGEISYPLYLVHQNLSYVVLARLVEPVGRAAASAVALALALLLAWLLHRIVEVPVSRWLRRALTRRRAAPPTAPATAARVG